MRKRVETEHYSVDDYRQWEGDWELIDGVAYAMASSPASAMAPSPAFAHQSIGGEIYAQLHQSLEDCPHCQALYEIDVEFAEDTVVRPEVLVICYQPKTTG